MIYSGNTDWELWWMSHISLTTLFNDVMEITKAPVIASHSSCRHFTLG